MLDQNSEIDGLRFEIANLKAALAACQEELTNSQNSFVSVFNQWSAAESKARKATREAAYIRSKMGLLSGGGSVDLRFLVSEAVRGRQAEVAAALGIRRATISEYLNKKTSMSADTVEAILNLNAAAKNGKVEP